jgi:hypothetical protein
MESVKQIKIRIGAARVVLDQHSGDAAKHSLISKVQSGALVASILASVADLTAEDRAELANLVVEANWHGLDGNAILQALIPPKTPDVLGKRRRTSQTFLSLPNYGDADFWMLMKDPAVPSGAKLDGILRLAISLGLRCPTEPTIKLITSLYLLVTEGPEEVIKTDSFAKRCSYQHVKHVFDGQRKGAGDPPSWIEVLPENPHQLLKDHEPVYKTVFRVSVPEVASDHIDVRLLQLVDMSFTCRGGAPKQSLQPAQVATPQQLALRSQPAGSSASCISLETSPVERLANMFMQKMESISMAQQRMFTVMMSGGLGPAAAGPSRALSALSFGEQPLPPLQPRRLPTMAFVEELPENAPLQQLAIAAPPAASITTPPAAVVAAAPTEPAATPAKAASVARDITDMLDMLSARKEDRKDTTKKRKLEVEGGSAKKQKKGGAKGKGKGKGKPLVELPTEVSATAKAKAKASAKKAAKSHVKNAAPKGKAAAKAGTGLVLGCSKCRNSIHGCARCRNPNYKGPRFNIAGNTA